MEGNFGWTFCGERGVVDLPIDTSLADPVKAEEYIAGLFNDETEERSDDAVSPDNAGSDDAGGDVPEMAAVLNPT